MLIELYSKENCEYCTKAKHLLNKMNLPYTEISAVDQRAQLIERVTTQTGNPPQTVPQIFIDDKHIGGYTELANHLDKI